MKLLLVMFGYFCISFWTFRLLSFVWSAAYTVNSLGELPTINCNNPTLLLYRHESKAQHLADTTIVLTLFYSWDGNMKSYQYCWYGSLRKAEGQKWLEFIMKSISLQDVQQKNHEFILNCHWNEKNIAACLWKHSSMQAAAKII